MNTIIIPLLAYRFAQASAVSGALMLLAVCAQVTQWALDDTPPFVLVSYTAPATYRGEAVIIRAKVKRDLRRTCSVKYSRTFFDADNVRTDLTNEPQTMTPQALADLNRRMPDALALSINIPVMAAKGIGEVVTPLEYVCNPWQKLYPLNVLMVLKVEVL